MQGLLSVLVFAHRAQHPDDQIFAWEGPGDTDKGVVREFDPFDRRHDRDRDDHAKEGIDHQPDQEHDCAYQLLC